MAGKNKNVTNRNFLFFILMFAGVFMVSFSLSSCWNHNPPPPTPPPKDWHVGWKLPQINVIIPSRTVTNHIPFLMSVFFDNNGAYGIKSQLISVSVGRFISFESDDNKPGVRFSDPRMFQLENSGFIDKFLVGLTLGSVIKGLSQSNPTPFESSFDFTVVPSVPVYLLSSSDRVSDSVSVDRCFSYEDYFNYGSLCLASNIYSKASNNACQFKRDVFFNGQGGPVGISKIHVTVMPVSDKNEHMVNIKFYFKDQFSSNLGENVTSSLISPKDGLDACKNPSALLPSDFNVVKINSVKLGGKEMKCYYDENSGGDYHKIYTFSSKSRNYEQLPLVCETPNPIDLRTNSEYTTTLSMNFSYVYHQHTVASVDIVQNS